ncbi:MAG: hypothetical protein HY868_23795 [Chloroflexi bacterium]|nr:hypothetical protein [Chloroflexota bacterium]
MQFGQFLKISVTLVVVIAILFLALEVQSAQRAQTWAPFTMIYQHEIPTETITARLKWTSTSNWSMEITSDTIHRNVTQTAPIINYTGLKTEFVNGVYSVVNSSGQIQSREQIEPGKVMSPGQWLMPGYEDTLKQRENFIQIGISPDGERQYRKQENRQCPKDPRGNPFDPACSAIQTIITDMTFGKLGVPLARTVRIDNQLVENWRVLELTFK